MLIITLILLSIGLYFLIKKLIHNNENFVNETSSLIHNQEQQIEEGLIRPLSLVYFDIDDTLTNADPEEVNMIIKFLTEERNCIIGIITASRRTINHVCFEGETNKYFDWVPKNLCVALNKNNFKTFNSHIVEAGETTEPYLQWDFGMKKGQQMKKGQKQHNIKPEDVHLFDDNINVLKQAQKVMPGSNFHIVDNNNCRLNLTLNRIKDIFKE